MSEPTEQNALEVKVIPSRRWLWYCLAMVIVPVIIGIILNCENYRVRGRQIDIGGWLYNYNGFQNDPNHPDQIICGYLREQVINFYMINNRYPTNAEGFSFIQNIGDWRLPQNINVRNYWGYNSNMESLYLDINGPTVRVYSQYIYYRRSAQDRLIWSYVYVNRSDLPDNNFRDMADYEPNEFRHVLEIYPNIWIYSNIMRNASLHNAEMVQDRSLLNSWETFLFILSFVCALLPIWLIVKLHQLVRGTPFAFIKVGVGIILTCIGAFGVLGIANVSFVSCYMISRQYNPIAQHLPSKNAETLEDLLSKLEKKGVLTPETVARIRQSNAENVQR